MPERNNSYELVPISTEHTLESRQTPLTEDQKVAQIDTPIQQMKTDQFVEGKPLDQMFKNLVNDTYGEVTENKEIETQSIQESQNQSNPLEQKIEGPTIVTNEKLLSETSIQNEKIEQAKNELIDNYDKMNQKPVNEDSPDYRIWKFDRDQIEQDGLKHITYAKLIPDREEKKTEIGTTIKQDTENKDTSIKIESFDTLTDEDYILLNTDNALRRGILDNIIPGETAEELAKKSDISRKLRTKESLSLEEMNIIKQKLEDRKVEEQKKEPQTEDQIPTSVDTTPDQHTPKDENSHLQEITKEITDITTRITELQKKGPLMTDEEKTEYVEKTEKLQELHLKLQMNAEQQAVIPDTVAKLGIDLIRMGMAGIINGGLGLKNVLPTAENRQHIQPSRYKNLPENDKLYILKAFPAHRQNEIHQKLMNNSPLDSADRAIINGKLNELYTSQRYNNQEKSPIDTNSTVAESTTETNKTAPQEQLSPPTTESTPIHEPSSV